MGDLEWSELATKKPGTAPAPAPERERDEADDFGRAPATWVIGIAWVLVLVAMSVRQGRMPIHYNPIRVTIDKDTSHEFGDLTGLDLLGGQWWRTVTASFVHYNIWHLGLNLLALLSLGWIVENWYGTGAFLAIYAAIAGLSNALAVVARLAMHYPQDVHSGGGSVVLFGLVTLVAVGGWRSRTRFGDFIRSRMVFCLVVNAAICYLLRHSLDNFAHATGALVGAVIGLAHPWLRRLPGTVAGKVAGLAGVATLAVCAADLVRADRIVWAERARIEREQGAWWGSIRAIEDKAQERLSRLKRQEEAVRALSRLTTILVPMAEGPQIEPAVPPRDVRPAAATTLATLATDPVWLDRGPTAAVFARLRDLVAHCGPRGLSPPQVVEFAALQAGLGRHLAELIGESVTEIDRLRADQRRIFEHPPPGIRVVPGRPPGR
ncbi:MAG TPA: rhomboid family intramembrane serine protease [Isosphaeraceae bacterium]|jgi:rhomboid protease GluP|nr:rhomboid family intramembrane serine protease [Isosphaeraceae bacterium]